MNNHNNPMTRIRDIVQKAMKEKGITLDDVKADLAAYRRGEVYTYGQDVIEEDDFVPYMKPKAWDDYEC